MESSCIVHSILLSLFQSDNFSRHLCCHRIENKPMLEETIPIISDADKVQTTWVSSLSTFPQLDKHSVCSNLLQ